MVRTPARSESRGLTGFDDISVSLSACPSPLQSSYTELVSPEVCQVISGGGGGGRSSIKEKTQERQQERESN